MEDAITHQTFGEMFEAERAAAAPGGILAAYTPVKTPSNDLWHTTTQIGTTFITSGRLSLRLCPIVCRYW